MRLAIIGTGLIGASVALAAKRAEGVSVSGFDPDGAALEAAGERGAVDEQHLRHRLGECRVITSVAAGHLDLDAVRIAGADLMQRNQMGHHEAQQYQRDGDHVEREGTIQCGIRHHVVAADPQRQIRSDERNGAEQVHDHLRAPVGHLAPRQQVAEKRFGHQAQEDRETEQPDQFARLAV